eukprot:390866-Rhodomonas_salina.2
MCCAALQIAAKNKIMLCGKPQDIEVRTAICLGARYAAPGADIAGLTQADFETMKRMKALAHWEREMRNRANAYQVESASCLRVLCDVRY